MIDDLRAINGYSPTPKQRLAHDAPERFILFGGAMGGGKTAWLCNEAFYHCLRYPRARVYLARYEAASFKKTTLLTLMDFIPVEYIKKHNRNDAKIVLVNGSEIYYGGLGDDIRKIEKLKSMELSAWGVDQVEEVSEKFFSMLNTRLRLNIPGVVYKGWMTANPSANWVRTRFIEKALEDHKFIPALPNENPFLPSDYEENLRKTLPEELLKAWIEGDWNVIASEFNVFDFLAVQEAMKRRAEASKALCYGVDVARFGQDETVIVRKAGNKITFEDAFVKKDLMTTAGKIVKVVGRDKAVPIKVDSIGVGAGVVDRLREQGYNVIEVIGSASPKNVKAYRNKRAENYFQLRELLPSLALPDDEKLRAQMMAIRYRVLSDGHILIESKEELRKRGLASPDRLDAVVIACSEEKKLTAADMEKYLPRFFRSGFNEWLLDELGLPKRVEIPERSPEEHEKILAKYGLTLEDEEEMRRSGRAIVGVTRPAYPPKDVDDRSPKEIMDDFMKTSGCAKILK
jgi:hypothetical protein